MLTIDEAIERERKQAEINRNNIISEEYYHNMPWITKSNEAIMRNEKENERPYF